MRRGRLHRVRRGRLHQVGPQRGHADGRVRRWPSPSGTACCACTGRRAVGGATRRATGPRCRALLRSRAVTVPTGWWRCRGPVPPAGMPNGMPSTHSRCGTLSPTTTGAAAAAYAHPTPRRHRAGSGGRGCAQRVRRAPEAGARPPLGPGRPALGAAAARTPGPEAARRRPRRGGGAGVLRVARHRHHRRGAAGRRHDVGGTGWGLGLRGNGSRVPAVGPRARGRDVRVPPGHQIPLRHCEPLSGWPTRVPLRSGSRRARPGSAGGS